MSVPTPKTVFPSNRAPGSFGEALKHFRLVARLSQEELAERARLSARGISDLERGLRRLPRHDTVRMLAAALNLNQQERAVLEAAARPDLPRTPPRLETGAWPRNLPSPPTSLIGRERELAMARSLLDQAGTRMLTLTGPAGVGKTRLALEIAGTSRIQVEHGVFLVELAPLREAALVASAIAGILAVRESGDQPVSDLLAAHLRDKRLLLLLDNFEHVLEAAPLVASLLAACPSLRVLATSRAALHLRGEQELQVGPLALPGGEESPPALLESIPAVSLFMQRARAVSPDLVLTAPMGQAVAAICRRLDGLPLALELAAARTRLLSPQALLARLDRRLPLLIGGAHDLPERHQTLRAAIAWSCGLLHPAEQTLFRRLAVFAGGASLAAVEAVCGAGTDLMGDLLDWFGVLVDNSLLLQPSAAADGEPRFRMLETIREYGWECLAASGELEETRRRHAAFFLALAEQADRAFRTPEQGRWLDELEREHDNLRVALTWSLEGGDLELGARLATYLARFWSAHDHLSEGRHWLERALEQSDHLPAAIRAGVLSQAGALASFQGDHGRGTRLAEASLAIYRELGDRQGLVSTLRTLGVAYQWQHDVARARPLLEESLQVARDLGDKARIAMALSDLGLLAKDAGDLARATLLLDESLAMRHESGDSLGLAVTLGNLGNITLMRGDWDRARALIERSMAVFESHGHQHGVATCLGNLGNLARAQGDLAGACERQEACLDLFRKLAVNDSIAQALCELAAVVREQGDAARAIVLVRESISLFHALEDMSGVAGCLEQLAALSAASRELARAARFLGAAARLRTQTAVPMEVGKRVDYERMVLGVRSSLGEEGFAEAWHAGQAMAVEQVIGQALE